MSEQRNFTIHTHTRPVIRGFEIKLIWQDNDDIFFANRRRPNTTYEFTVLFWKWQFEFMLNVPKKGEK